MKLLNFIFMTNEASITNGYEGRKHVMYRTGHTMADLSRVSLLMSSCKRCSGSIAKSPYFLQ